MANDYHVSEYGVNSMPITGMYLAHTPQKSLVKRAYMGGDLFTGARPFISPTLGQCAYLAKVSKTYVWWAVRRQAERAEVEAGLIPLVPHSDFVPKACNNINDLPMPKIEIIPDLELVEFVRAVGVNRVRDAAALAEVAE